MKFNFTVATANIQNTPDLPRTEVREAARVVARYADLIGFQEIREGQDVIDVREGMGDGWGLAEPHCSTPIGVRYKKFKPESSTKYVFHQGYSAIPTPRRQAAALIVKPKHHPFHPELAVLNAHMINGAWNGNHPDTEEERRLLWKHSWRVLQVAVREQHIAGRNVIVVGDLNRRDVTLFHPDMKWVWDQDIDKIGILMQPGWRVTVQDKWQINNPSDHNALLAHLTIERKR